MLKPFSKYEGSGNDFIFFNNLEGSFSNLEKVIIQKLCHRQKGIGADGIILLEPSSKAAFKMRIFNADGSEAEMCGNGIRCFKKFLEEVGHQEKNYSIETYDRLLSVETIKNGVEVEMGNPKKIQWDLFLDTPHGSFQTHYLDTGVPHLVHFTESIEQFPLKKYAPSLRFHPSLHPNGANVNVVEVLPQNMLSIRTYERGVEEETLACGTGATAAALAAAHIHGMKSPIQVKTRTDEILTISFKIVNSFYTQIKMAGPANFCFKGEVWID